MPPARNKWKRASRVGRKIQNKNKKNLVALLDRKGETYEPPANDACSKMCYALPEFKEYAKHISTLSHVSTARFSFIVM